MKSEKQKDVKTIPEKDKTKETREDKEDGMKRNLYRSKKDKIIAGVFGGIAEYLSVDPVLLRIIGVILFFARPGEFIIMYIAAAIIMPETKDGDEEKTAKEQKNESSGRLFIGGGLVILGIIFLLQKYISWFNWDYLWPFIIIGAGVYLLVRK